MGSSTVQRMGEQKMHLRRGHWSHGPSEKEVGSQTILLEEPRMGGVVLKARPVTEGKDKGAGGRHTEFSRMICSRKPADARATPPLQVASLRTGGLDVKPQSQGDLCESPWPLIVATGRMTHPHKPADLILFSKPFFFFSVVLSRAGHAPSTEAGVGF